MRKRILSLLLSLAVLIGLLPFGAITTHADTVVYTVQHKGYNYLDGLPKLQIYNRSTGQTVDSLETFMCYNGRLYRIEYSNFKWDHPNFHGYVVLDASYQVLMEIASTPYLTLNKYQESTSTLSGYNDLSGYRL